MADAPETKKSALHLFKAKLKEAKKIEEHLLEGIKHTNAKIRSHATKAAFKTQSHDFIKKHVLPLIESEKSKKVLRTIGGKIKRDKLVQKLEKWVKEIKTKVEKPAAEEPPKV